MSDPVRAVLAIVTACVIWGLSPLYYALLDSVVPIEVLAHRTLWSFLFFVAVIALQRRLRDLAAAVATPSRAGLILAAGLAIGFNWFGFIFAIHSGRALEASLGYYVFPLFAVLLGRLVFGEALTRVQWAAVGLAGLAVTVLTAGLGVPPFVALGLAASFAIYGALKKRIALGPILSVTAEVLLLLPLALGFLAVFGHAQPLPTLLLLMLSGPLTATPLMLFSYAARRLRFATVGLVQYLNPTLQFLVAVLVFTEPFTPWHAIAFPIIWIALALYSASAIARDRATRRAAAVPL
ncbi:EamA family transporter RarD [Oceanicola granulosus]|uniref:EamA family transporter RarD n=1 Tax=Oceanicola granulosus TaxID=252302 RepID=UPI00058B1FC1|nr:EamA family transporter RarD [Oceanicola granulosus]